MKILKNDILDLSPDQWEEAAQLLRQAATAELPNQETIEAESESWSISEETIQRLPLLLRKAAGFLPTDDEKSVFLTTAFPVIAGCLPNTVLDHYDGEVKPNLYAAVFAEAGAGKGALRYARKLGEDLERHLRESSTERLRAWEESEKNQENSEPKPVSESLFISLNSSSRGMIDALSANRGNGVVCDSELLTAIIGQRNEWGNNRDILLKAAQNETIDLDRKGGERIWIPDPQLSVAVTGTPSAFSRFFPTVEDGLFSRFNFYSFSPPVQWRSQRPTRNSSNRNHHFEEASKALTAIYSALRSRETPFVVELGEESWDDHDSLFCHLLGNEAHPLNASVKRAGLAAVRVTTILTVLRLAESGTDLATVSNTVATSEDVRTGRELACVWLYHAFKLGGASEDLQARQEVEDLTSEQKRFRAALIERGTFRRADAQRIAVELGLVASERTIDEWIGYKLPGIYRQGHGVYRAANSSEVSVANSSNSAKSDDEEVNGSDRFADFAGLEVASVETPPFSDTS